MAFNKIDRRNKIRAKIRASISGSAERPRMSVFRSNKGIYVQLIDDASGTTMVAASSMDKGIADAKVENNTISISVNFISEQMLNNDEGSIVKNKDTWTFEKPVNSSSPIWILTQT